MHVVYDPESCPRPPEGTVVTIGVYDGVHVGHRAVIAETRRLAAERGCETAVVTFDRHPEMVLRPVTAPRLLTDVDQKLELLATTGLDHALVIRFDEERSRETADDFVRQVLVGCLGARAVVVGHDFHFGHNREGSVAFLAGLGGELGFDVLGLRLVEDDQDHERVSSTRIRRLLREGDVEEAARLLGRPHEVRGRVVEGDRRGREWGFPTANVHVPAEIEMPADGIYAGWYERPDGSVHATAISLGRRPTVVDGGEVLLEAYLLDFAGDLYGEAAKVRFVHRLRDEIKFDDVDALIAQIGRDVEAVREVLS